MSDQCHFCEKPAEHHSIDKKPVPLCSGCSVELAYKCPDCSGLMCWGATYHKGMDDQHRCGKDNDTYNAQMPSLEKEPKKNKKWVAEQQALAAKATAERKAKETFVLDEGADSMKEQLAKWLRVESWSAFLRQSKSMTWGEYAMGSAYFRRLFDEEPVDGSEFCEKESGVIVIPTNTFGSECSSGLIARWGLKKLLTVESSVGRIKVQVFKKELPVAYAVLIDVDGPVVYSFSDK